MLYSTCIVSEYMQCIGTVSLAARILRVMKCLIKIQSVSIMAVVSVCLLQVMLSSICWVLVSESRLDNIGVTW